jgi:hypothetical protein
MRPLNLDDDDDDDIGDNVSVRTALICIFVVRPLLRGLINLFKLMIYILQIWALIKICFYM